MILSISKTLERAGREVRGHITPIITNIHSCFYFLCKTKTVWEFKKLLYLSNSATRVCQYGIDY